jgi:hypothetical chaperone protein
MHMNGPSAASFGSIGVDFGTTNTVLSIAGAEGRPHLVEVDFEGSISTHARSTLSFHEGVDAAKPRVVEPGPWAIEAYLEEPLETRLIQSFKSYAASPLFKETRILGRRFAFEDLLSAYMLRLRDHAGLTRLPTTAIVGRPVNFAGSSPDPALAVARYQKAFERLGFTDIRYAYEPVAAAFFFARRLTADATVMVGDFGGGTSDFSIVRFHLKDGEIASSPLANTGVGVAGDAFDYRIIDNLVSPWLGKGSSYKAFDNILPVPNRYFAAFARWEQLALLKASRDMADIRALRRTALQPEKIDRLVEILDDNHGYRLYQAVSKLKETLSSAAEAEFVFEAGSVAIAKRVTRERFEAWIAPELAAIEGAVDAALAQARLEPNGIDRVFLTGGSSFVPAVRRIFAERFGEARLESGGELVSIASGLSLIGLERDLDRWCERAPAMAT